jgi:tRNA-Thr(GGU) m(6)t(6)A37 methyltransferase TsaA
VVFEPEFRRAEAVRGLEEFSHVWIVFLFEAVGEAEVRTTVRPPRLGGNEKRGVFATRSPFRPNRIGLSVCALEGIEAEGEEAPVLVLAGVDLVDGTPVLDVKPYLPYADRVEGATSGFADERPEAVAVAVEIAEEANADFAALPEATRQVICESLQWDARPAYHEAERTYFLRVEDREVAWRVVAGVCRITGVSAIKARN